jgi:hypothetical protein
MRFELEHRGVECVSRASFRLVSAGVIAAPVGRQRARAMRALTRRVSRG